MDDADDRTRTDAETDGGAGSETGSETGDETPVGSGTEELSEAEQEQIEAERRERLDPANRPDNVEVDNTDRDFDATTGQFTDHETDPDIGPFPAPGEDADSAED
ncbi:hypothetical protein [Nocardioides donggukensis]|uniref:Uncharacterized protein n=1 Tax=Nocardioides donggukensis TaxID=2774019 RepID=A0A927K6Y9_9ACTN|nr:hypothetical protein [Nocardioides donggukensis]MBD8871071.1 hypothetical protein [Nocardioides donggukensis]